jgi:hypothetical protein
MTDIAANNEAAPANGDAPQKEIHINIKVKAQDGTEIYFKIKRST